MVNVTSDTFVQAGQADGDGTRSIDVEDRQGQTVASLVRDAAVGYDIQPEIGFIGEF